MHILFCRKFRIVNDIKWAFFVAEKELQQEEEEDDEGGDQDEGAGSMLGPGTDVINSGDVGVLFLEQLEQANSISDRTDFTNFRGLLWSAMNKFPDRVEPRSRELSPLLLRFVRCVYAYVCACIWFCEHKKLPSAASHSAFS